MPAGPDTPPVAPERLPPAEWNATERPYPHQHTVHELFEAQAGRTPGAVALVSGDARLSYAELNARANRLAHHLRERGVGPEVLVGVCMERGVEMVVALLGVLKAGAAYVPLDPGYPAERLAFMLGDAGAAVLLTQEHLRGALPEGGAAEVLCVDAEWESIALRSGENPPRAATPDTLAYVIYTSGSTGTPKGVMIEHRALCNHMAWLLGVIPLGAADAVLQKTPISFDASVWEFYAPLLAGARLVMARPGGHRDPAYLREEIRRSAVTAVQTVPSLLRMLLEEADPEPLGSLRWIVCGGEPLPRELAQRCLDASGAELWNFYGPTEACIDATAHRVASPVAAAPPIGRPVANMRAYVLDEALRPVPVGADGELYLAGAQLARGYWKRPELTAERFLRARLDGVGEERLYRTGDRVRWLADGTLEFVGRADHQVKVRGFRIEPGEVEAALLGHPAVRQAVVVARADEDDPSDRRLVAYVVAEGGAAEAELREHAKRLLPEHMVPSAFVALERMPLTPSGKVDREALPAPRYEAAAERYVAPRSATEELLAAAWAEVLGVERVGVEDDFFELGGHSLRATRVAARVRDLFQVELPLSTLFEHSTIAALAPRVEEARRARGGRPVAPLAPVRRDGPIPLSFAQEALWFLQDLYPGIIAYNFQAFIRFSGDLDVEALAAALTEIVRRHEIFRTTFHRTADGPVQVVHDPWAVLLPVTDLREVEAERRDEAVLAAAAREFRTPFDLSEVPLARWRLLRTGDAEYVLAHAEHHFIHDGWSFGLFLRELTAIYAAVKSGRPADFLPRPVQFADYVAWYRARVENELAEEQLAYWKRRLEGVPPLLELPSDRPRPPVMSFRGESFRFRLSPRLVSELRALGRARGATFYMTLLAAFDVLLHRYSRQEEFCVGVGVANRHSKEAESVIGMLVNTVPLRFRVTGSETFAGLLRQVRAEALAGYAHEDVPFDRVVEALNPERSLRHLPVYQAAFSFNDAPIPGFDLPGVRMDVTEGISNGSTKLDLNVVVVPRPDQRNSAGDDEPVTMIWEFSTDLYDRSTMERMGRHYVRLLESIAADPERRVSRLEMLEPGERERLLAEWNATDAPYPGDTSVSALFEAWVERTPGAVALVDGDERLTYAELDARADALARALVAGGVAVGDRVAILLPRSAALVVAELAVLKAGAAYVPVDPSFPADRIAFMVADAGARVALCLAGEAIPELPGVRRIDVDAVDGNAAAALPALRDGGAPAYVMYTSGSTGRPKGVMVPHRAIARLVIDSGYADFGPDDRVAFAANPAFDATTMEVWGPLLNGGRVVVIPPEVVLEPAAFGRALARHGVGVLWLTVGLFNQYADALREELSALRCLIVGGDRLDPAVVARVLRAGAPGRLLNGYGPTETTTFALTHRVRSVAEDGRGIPLGRPIANTRVYLLDGEGEPVPVGAAGELYIGGAGVAMGYLERFDLTAERFVPDPFSEKAGARMYRTGDLGRWLADGSIDFLGRTDHQVKVRGFRVEPGEIEAVLLRHPAVREALVLAREDGGAADRSLAAYVVADGGLTAAELREHARERLPEYMVPAAFVLLEKMPLTPNGKLDRGALPAPSHETDAETHVAPRTAMEGLLAGIWAEVLGVERVGVTDNFFDLGGHSLRATQVAGHIRELFQIELLLHRLFEHPTIARLAPVVSAAVEAQNPDLLPMLEELAGASEADLERRLA